MKIINNQNKREREQIVEIGSAVSYKDFLGNIHTYIIASDQVINFLEGIVSIDTPLAKAVLGKTTRETVVVKTSYGEYPIEIIEII